MKTKKLWGWHCYLLFAFLCVTPAVADENFEWHVPDDEDYGCWELTDGPASKPCLLFWQGDEPPTPHLCAGLCDIWQGNPTCVLNRTMQGLTTGPDMDTEQLQYNEVFADPGEPQGNKPRRRYLMCIKEFDCLCEFNEVHEQWFCVVVPDSTTYGSGGLYLYDANGPECEEEESSIQPASDESEYDVDSWQWNQDDDWDGYSDGEFGNE